MVDFNAIVSAHAEAQAKVAPSRQARCSCCQALSPSNRELPFFEDRSEDSPRATDTCKHCRCYEVAHHRNGRGEFPSVIGKVHLFEPHGPYEFDSFYCGCRGWE